MKGISRRTALFEVLSTIQVQIAGIVTSKSPIAIALIKISSNPIMWLLLQMSLITWFLQKEKAYIIIEFVVSEEEYGLTHPACCLPNLTCFFLLLYSCFLCFLWVNYWCLATLVGLEKIIYEHNVLHITKTSKKESLKLILKGSKFLQIVSK